MGEVLSVACYTGDILFNDLAKPFIPLFYVDITIKVWKKLFFIYTFVYCFPIGFMKRKPFVLYCIGSFRVSV